MKDHAWVAAIIALAIVLLYCGLIMALLFRPIPAVNASAFNGLVTALVSIVTGVIGYYFGSSRTTEQHLAERLKPTVPPPLAPKN